MEKRRKDKVIVIILYAYNDFEARMKNRFLWLEEDFRKSSTHYKVTDGNTIFMIEKFKCLLKYQKKCK